MSAARVDTARGAVLIEAGAAEALDAVGPLWTQLNALHARVSPHFGDRFPTRGFEDRRADLERKAADGALLVLTARLEATGAVAGYCICTVDARIATGEVDSILVEDALRGQGIGERLMREAMAWFDARGVSDRIVTVAVGNEAAFPFYERFGFYPRLSVLKWKG